MKETLSLCMIVKNEEKYLHDCLQSVCDVVDQIVIVDTGSTDKTISIAKKFKAEIYHFDWINDFSAARNDSIKYAKCDWILWLDADERLQKSSKEKIKHLLTPEKKPVIYRVQINSIVNNGDSLRMSSAHRLFTNHKGIYFSGKIHEQVAESAAKLVGEERPSDIILDHLGYDLDAEEQSSKDKRNLKLLQKAVQSDPQNGYAHYTLAQQYGLMKQWDKALQHYDTAEKLNQFDKAMMASMLNTKAEALFNLKIYNQVKECCTESIGLEPVQVGAYYLLYRIADAEKNPEECISHLEIMLKNIKILKEKPKKISTDVLIREEKVLYTLALNCVKVKDFPKAIQFLEQTIRLNPDKTEFREKLIEIYLKQSEYERAKAQLEVLINQSSENEKYKDIFGTILIKQQKFAQAINLYEKLVLQNPENKECIKKLIGLYGKTGAIEKANQLMFSIS